MISTKELVAELAATHAAAFARCIGILDLAVQDATAMMSKSAIPMEEWDGSVVKSNVRQFATHTLSAPSALAGTQLRFESRQNLGMHLFTPDGARIRIRYCMRDAFTGHPLQVVRAPWETQPALIDAGDVSSLPFEYALFWSMSKKSDGLGKVFLAAVDFSQEPNPALYALLPLSATAAISDAWGSARPEFLDNLDTGDDDYGWEQDFGQGENPE